MMVIGIAWCFQTATRKWSKLLSKHMLLDHDPQRFDQLPRVINSSPISSEAKVSFGGI